ncbi:MAG: phospho-sugar mutase [Aquiluna sp.]|nr:phospho-sugar mutase [Aquiluna sp.]
MSDLLTSAQAWLDQDPDQETSAELKALIDTSDLTALASRFENRIAFGTAGLRGELGAGPARMNRVVVCQTAAGLAEFLKVNREVYKDSNGELSAVVGFDGRINSDVFAKDTAEIFAAAGITTHLFSECVPTPVAAFTGRKINASVTVVVTASHNPPRDNGYKVYLGGPTGGSQLVPPQDAEIADQIAKIAATKKLSDLARSSDYSTYGEREIANYIDRAKTLVSQSGDMVSRRSKIHITHTALHGVGWKVVKPLMAELGFNVSPVELQAEPDGAFPTVAFPNPEEKGAMDLAFETATALDSALIIANDPDADRLAVAVKVSGGYQMLTGDEVGLLLANEMAPHSKAIANSIVSADLTALAEHHGVSYTQTLTGFKWISKVPDLGYGYEEALGYCVDPEYTPDKDGITAALIISEMAVSLAHENKNLLDKLAELADALGHVATGQVSIRVTNLDTISKIMSGLRKDMPIVIAGLQVASEDYLARTDMMQTDALIFQNDRIKIIIRPSGTEPKLKCYLQAGASSSDEAKKLLAELENWANTTLSALQ